MWTDDEVLAKASAWSWTPFDAVIVESGGFKLELVRRKATVRAWPDRDPGSIVAEAIELAEANDAEKVEFATHDRTRPPGLAGELKRRGGEVAQELDVSAFPLGNGLPAVDVPDGIEVRTVSTMDDQLLVYGVDMDSFGDPMPSKQFQRADEEELARQVALGKARDGFRMLALIDGRPVGSAGLTLDGTVAKLWGGGVIAEYRGRGVYRALLQARLEVAVSRGVGIALVKARTGTSAPILRRAGFRSYGREIHWHLWSRSASHPNGGRR